MAKPVNIRGQFPLFGRRIRYARVRAWFVKAAEDAGIEDVRLHDLSRAWKPAWRRHIIASAPPVTTPPVDEQAVADAQLAIEDMVARFG